MPPSLKRPLELWHLILAVAIPILGFIVSATMAYAGFTYTDKRHDTVIQNHETRLDKEEDSVNDIKYNVTVIGEKLGVGSRLKR